MKRTINLKTLGAGLVAAAALALAACNPGTLPPNTIGVPPGAGTQKASITGSVVKADLSPARNATLVLIQKTGGADRDVQVVRTDSNGLYRFADIQAGEYRLAFVLQTESERKDPNAKPKFYDPAGDPQTAQYFSFITTANFVYGGNSGAAFQVPQMNVGWVSNLSPHATTVDSGKPVSFNWAAVPGATNYILDIRDANNNPFYKSGNITGTSFSWSDLRGNQGNNNGVAVKSGTYYYLVNARLNRTSAGEGPTPNYGGTALAKFTVR
ncbi:MAG: carboxypeptidase-like regulatory domain-containing protein [Candidatus Sericytochromatia bacterium]